MSDEIDRSQCHWACTYPKNKRPRSVKDGAIIFMGRLVRSPNDTMIYGKAVGSAYRDGDDDASPEDIAHREWKEKWPHYIRVHNPEFMAGNLENGVSLNSLMNALGADAFASTQRNAEAGAGNTNPRRAFRQQAAVALTPKAAAWVDKRLDAAFATHGKITDDELVYRVAYCTDLVSNVWNTAASSIGATSNTCTYTDPAVPDHPTRYYRVLALP